MLRLFVVLFSVIIFSSPACADWINLTGAENTPNMAEIYIEDDHVRIDLEILVGDITISRLKID